jgi:hypothetical protein
MFLIIHRSIDFYNEFYVHLSCGFLVVLDYDEMNCNLVFGIFYNVSNIRMYGNVMLVGT